MAARRPGSCFPRAIFLSRKTQKAFFQLKHIHTNDFSTLGWKPNWHLNLTCDPSEEIFNFKYPQVIELLTHSQVKAILRQRFSKLKYLYYNICAKSNQTLRISGASTCHKLTPSLTTKMKRRIQPSACAVEGGRPGNIT